MLLDRKLEGEARIDGGEGKGKTQFVLLVGGGWGGFDVTRLETALGEISWVQKSVSPLALVQREGVSRTRYP